MTPAELTRLPPSDEGRAGEATDVSAVSSPQRNAAQASLA